MKKGRISYIAKIGVLSAIAALLMLFEFPLPFAPSFYKLDLSEIAVLISGFALGPLAAVLTELIKILINLMTDYTTTAFVGEIANFAIGVSFVLPAAWVYKKNKTLKGAVLGMLVGTISLAFVGAMINYFIMIPAYSHFYHLPLTTIIGMGTKLNPAITGLPTFIMYATVPFNIIKGVLCSFGCLLIYKRVSPILHK